MKPDRVAVELNRAIVPRDQWDQTQLAEGDQLEIVHFVGGGCSSGVSPAVHRSCRYFSTPKPLLRSSRNFSSHPSSSSL